MNYINIYVCAVSPNRGTLRILLPADFRKGSIIPVVIVLHLEEPNKKYSSTPLRTYTQREYEIQLPTTLPVAIYADMANFTADDAACRQSRFPFQSTSRYSERTQGSSMHD